MTQPDAFRTAVLLSFQRALWEMVTPSLRGISVRLVYPLIEARFIYEAVTDEEVMIASEVEAYVAADFVPPVDVGFEAVAMPSSQPRELEPGEEWVYLRREAEPS